MPFITLAGGPYPNRPIFFLSVSKSEKMRKIYLLFLFTAMHLVNAKSQNDVQFTQFMFNKIGYNPAFAGSDKVLTVNAIYRHQWSGVEGAPRTLNAHIHTPFAKNRCGIGLSLTSDQIGMFNTTFVELSYAYKIPFGRNTLSIGVNGRVEHGQIDWTKANSLDQVDALIQNAESSVTTPNFGFGAVYGGERFFAGVSLNQLLNNSYFQHIDLPEERELNMRTIYLMGGAVFNLGQKVEFQPVLLASYNRNAPFDLDINLGFTFVDAFFAGLSYRLDDSADLLLAYQITKQFRLGAAYDFTISELSQGTSGSFEIMMQYRFIFDDLGIRNLRFF